MRGVRAITTKGTKEHEGDPVMPEADRIADQLRRAYYGGAWHGD